MTVINELFKRYEDADSDYIVKTFISHFQNQKDDSKTHYTMQTFYTTEELDDVVNRLRKYLVSDKVVGSNRYISFKNLNRSATIASPVIGKGSATITLD